MPLSAVLVKVSEPVVLQENSFLLQVRWRQSIRHMKKRWLALIKHLKQWDWIILI
jgi:hypothetical protein